MGDPRERNYQSLFSELAGYEKKGVYMLMNGVPASPMQIVQAHIVREDAVYMRDYVLNDNGDIKELFSKKPRPQLNFNLSLFRFS